MLARFLVGAALQWSYHITYQFHFAWYVAVECGWLQVRYHGVSFLLSIEAVSFLASSACGEPKTWHFEKHIFSVQSYLRQHGFSMFCRNCTRRGLVSYPLRAVRVLPWRWIPSFEIHCSIPWRFKKSRPLRRVSECWNSGCKTKITKRIPEELEHSGMCCYSLVITFRRFSVQCWIVLFIHAYPPFVSLKSVT